ncbi:NAD(P)-binding protein [Xylariaceae sp. FL0594]|nr:NAD(P)-binding protein [Xylariaceae sp. FL0594]
MASASLDPPSLFDVKGLVAVVTGGGTGIGLMMAQALEANGAVVYIIGRRKESLEKAAATAKHNNIRPVVGDVTSKSSLTDAASAIGGETGGYVDLVIANSGIGGPSLDGLAREADMATLSRFLQSVDTAAFNQTFATNVTGVFSTVAAFLPLLDAGNRNREGEVRARIKQRSQIIAISSIGAYNRLPLAGYAYGPSKAAVVLMMKQFASWLAPHGIRSNVIAPGFYPSELTTPLFEARAAQKEAWPKTMVPEERAGDLEDMAGTVLYLASRAGAYVNGNVLVTDGGRLGVVPSTY